MYPSGDPFEPELIEDEAWYPFVEGNRTRITLPGRTSYVSASWGELYRALVFAECAVIALTEAATYTIRVEGPQGSSGAVSMPSRGKQRVGVWASTEHLTAHPITAYGAGFLGWSPAGVLDYPPPPSNMPVVETTLSDGAVELVFVHPGAPYLGAVYVGFYVESCVWFYLPYMDPWSYYPQWVTDSAAFADWFRVTKTVPHPQRRAHPVHRVIDCHSGLRFPATTHEPDTSEAPVSENDCGALIVAGNEPVTVVDADTLIIGQVLTPQPPASWSAWWKRLYYDNPWPAQRPRSLWKAQALEY